MKAYEVRVGQATTYLRHLVSFWLDVVFPPVCANCRRVGWMLCPDCLAQMPRVPDDICARCGRFTHLDAERSPGRICDQCRATPPVLSMMRAPLRYDEPVSTLIHRFKYEGYFALGGPLARFLIEDSPAWAPYPDIILPIPIHDRRRRRRGYNQSELLARPLAEHMGIPFQSSAIRRIRHTKPQVGLGPQERHENVRDAFRSDETAVRGRHVLLVDDVLTTGATLTAAAESLLASGATSVQAYCLARVG